METYGNKQTNYRTRIKSLEGQRHVVVPVIMMVEGVHSGSHGAIFHSAEELGRYTAAWNGIPIVVHHPEVEGVAVSANSPEVLESYRIGRVFNTQLVGNQLRAEAWLNEDLLKNRFVAVDAYIEEKKPLEVSVGVFTDETPVENGEWNGESYKAIAVNYRPDHLALLPGEIGACSWSDGCGIRNNSNPFLTLLSKEDHGTLSAMNQLGFQINKVSFSETAEKIYGYLNSLDKRVGENWMESNYMEDTFEGYFIYRKRINANGTSDAKFYQQQYTINDADNALQLVGEPVEVKKEIKYTKISPNNNKKERITTMSKGLCKESKVDAIINSNSTKFGEGDRDWLLTMEDGQLEKLLPTETPAPAPVNNAAAPKTAEEFIASAPKEFQESLNAGLTLHKKNRETLITGIMANSASKDAWKKETLEGMETSVLESIYKSIPGQSLHLGGGSPAPQNNSAESTEEVLMPFGV